ncbi:alkaline phosphatase D family protein [Henriciella sp.]|uniref:alkaline phosphatase D family protein n=1 Tax=Henriciella sp. TaxID=1968823 RepID=UPI00260CB4B8|nr:alkaline phosphatase D family protein [Henriciella sp.]
MTTDTPFLRPRRRDLLAGSGALTFAGFTGAGERQAPTTLFPFGVASGDPLSDRCIIWTRLARTPLKADGGMPAKPVTVKWFVASASAPAKTLRRGEVRTRPGLGHSVHVDVTGLAPGQACRYWFEADGETSPGGLFRTSDPASDTCRLAVACCNNYEHGYFTAFDHIADLEPDVLFHAGDYIYEKAAKPGLPRQHIGGECMNLTDYRRRYAQYRLDPSMQRMHAAVPIIASWDDHEVAGNWAGMYDKQRSPVFAHRRKAAFQAFYEFMPVRARPAPGWTALQLYRAFTFGAGLRFFALDTRQYRSDQACGDKTQRPCDALHETDRTMLGAAQKSWLEGKLATLDGGWAVIGQQVPSYRQIVHDSEGPWISMDKWDGYPGAQADFHAMLARYTKGRTLVISGDSHAHYLSELRTDWGDPHTRFGMELTVTSVTSSGDGNERRESWEPLSAQNPHIIDHHDRRGFCLIEATRETLTIQPISFDKISQPGASALYRKRFEMT